MKLVNEFNVENKKVILRCDLNVSIKDGKILDDEKIVASLETINYLVNQKAKVIIMSHLGRVKEDSDKKDNSLYIVYQRLCELVPSKVSFCMETHGEVLENMINELSSGEILLMENTRFEDLDGEKESKNNQELAKYWACLGEIFINDAFGMTHRKHASNSGISKYLPSGIGFLIDKELKGLDILINPVHPFTVIMSGAKVEDKIVLIANILKKCDNLLLGGGIANTFLAINNNVGKSLMSPDSLDEVKKLLNEYSSKILLPVDVVTENAGVVATKRVSDVDDNDIIYDIGPETIKLYESKIVEAQTIFINGVAGMYEDERFINGTKAVLSICSESPGKVVLGGGDALASTEFFGINNFYFMSTGGGATLDYIGSEKLACMEK